MVKRTRWTDMDKRDTPFAKLRAAYRVYNQTTGKSPHTIRWSTTSNSPHTTGRSAPPRSTPPRMQGI